MRSNRYKSQWAPANSVNKVAQKLNRDKPKQKSEVT